MYDFLRPGVSASKAAFNTASLLSTPMERNRRATAGGKLVGGGSGVTISRPQKAADAPFDAEQGRSLIRNTIKAIDALPISEGRRAMIFAGNARTLLKLPVATGARAGSEA